MPLSRHAGPGTGIAAIHPKTAYKGSQSRTILEVRRMERVFQENLPQLLPWERCVQPVFGGVPHPDIGS